MNLMSSFICPITQEEMVNPVLTPDGTTYERSAIETWIKARGDCPQTRAPLRIDQLVPNRALLRLIEEQRTSKTIARPELKLGISSFENGKLLNTIQPIGIIKTQQQYSLPGMKPTV